METIDTAHNLGKGVHTLHSYDVQIRFNKNFGWQSI